MKRAENHPAIPVERKINDALHKSHSVIPERGRSSGSPIKNPMLTAASFNASIDLDKVKATGPEKWEIFPTSVLDKSECFDAIISSAKKSAGYARTPQKKTGSDGCLEVFWGRRNEQRGYWRCAYGKRKKVQQNMPMYGQISTLQQEVQKDYSVIMKKQVLFNTLQTSEEGMRHEKKIIS